MPHEVVEALVVGYVGQPVGREMYDRVKATMEKYPDFFKQYAKTHSKQS